MSPATNIPGHSQKARHLAFEWLRALATQDGAPAEAGVAFDEWARLASSGQAASAVPEELEALRERVRHPQARSHPMTTDNQDTAEAPAITNTGGTE